MTGAARDVEAAGPLVARPDVVGLLAALEARGWTLATAESLTGGLLSATIVDVPGASRVLRGAVVAYATDVKQSVLGVDGDLLAAHGAVHPDVARQMAERVREVLGADVGVATTGVAGPDPQDGRPPGTVFVAASGPRGTHVRRLHLDGERAAVRAGTVAAAVDLARAVTEDRPSADRQGEIRG
ncbi:MULTISPECIES: CinA family protein [Cellulosimicrobium]|uniref:CinA family protein n=1 Tax=Cellulosimicrobium sp. ES-005 TaxID=3163031 RepID=A0AAU8FTY7_9MICO|nr:CinA family protein [Cellulosimicrobium cellulans]MCO7273129.1 CinA family protein [Cellulosimicrobium cellulans]